MEKTVTIALADMDDELYEIIAEAVHHEHNADMDDYFLDHTVTFVPSDSGGSLVIRVQTSE